ncbi:hypothetical protein BD324DRAFT_620604 [Kockovaella imperatae]|uniref:Copper-fist domain-containing protein n=1 Tax=Kockovaella imperatae TaxID=4999 RepID=A0A1Y1UK64_9TREE|nr:hypothetical protein BD324DRAFT_620604 [Kockovaella imperatae]ORX38372.1 hypothetical protein BD324DRAFT_620604 [Kockovaella imperatae]
MVLVNDKKFACATCIKGHRVSGCTHTDRPLFEVKKKGRPSTQCNHCKDKRKGAGGPAGGSVHVKCQCGDPIPPEMIMPGSSRPIQPSQDPNDHMETRKGQPGSKATLPNGLKDIHDMAAAAEALSAFQRENEMQMAHRKVANLLNPCHCKTGGLCKCCEPKREKTESVPSPVPSTSSGSRTPNGDRPVITDKFIEMFQSKATTGTQTSTSSRVGPTWAQLMATDGISPENKHHPAHTSSHVHKTKLYSPYTPPSGHTTPRHAAGHQVGSNSHHVGWASSSSSSVQPKIKPIADMNQFLGAVFQDDGSIATEIPRSALGLPGIQTFDTAAEQGGVKVEPAEMEVDAPVTFPTQDDVVIGACTCGDECDCPGCVIHGNATTATDSTAHCCGEHCSSTFDCADHLSFPRGISSIGHMLSIAAANVPHPPRHRSTDLTAHDTFVMPSSARHSDDAARQHGVVPLKRLECCNGRCQCPSGNCSCKEDCCGCCTRCACDEEGDTAMQQCPPGGQPSQSACCKVPAITPPIAAQREPILAPTPPNGSLLSPQSAVSSNNPTEHVDPLNAPELLRRSSSSASKSSKGSALGRRATVGSQSTGTNTPSHRTISTGKAACKSLALHQPPQHPHSHSRPHVPKQPNPPVHPNGPPVSVNHIHRPGSSGLRTPTDRRASAASSVSVPIATPERTNTNGFSLGNFQNDGELMDYINSLTSGPATNFDTSPFSLTGSTDPSRNPLSAAAAPQLDPFDVPMESPAPNMTDQEILDMLVQAMNPSPPTQPQEQQQQPPQQQQPQQQPQQPQQHQQQPEPSDYQYFDPNNFEPNLPVSTFSGQTVLDNIGFPTSLADLYVRERYEQDTTGPPPPEVPTIRTLPPSSAAFLQGLLSNQQDNPNLIDLSKPLTASDVEKILRALQNQGGGGGGGGGGGAGTAPQDQRVQSGEAAQATMTNQPLFSGNGISPEQASETGSNVSARPGSEQGSSNNDVDDLFAKFVFDPNLLRDANGEMDLTLMPADAPTANYDLLSMAHGFGMPHAKSTNLD